MEKLLQLYKFVDGVNDSPFPNATQQAILYEFRYDAKRMGNAPTISGTLMHPLCLDNLWGNDLVYIVYNSERYFLKQTPTSSYSNEDTRYKHEVDFVSERIVLNDVYFYDVVQGDTNIDKPVSNSSSFTFYGDIHEFAQRLNYSLQYAKVGYSVVVDEGISSEAKMISFQNQFIANALQESYNTYEIPYYFVGRVIHIGFTDNAITRTFRYGIDDALLSITKSNANYKVLNRVTGTGSSDNIPYYYPNKYESKEQVEAEGETWIPPQTNLMPPIYRESLGDERFYNALNGTYINPQTNDYYEFANPYQDGKPKEQIVSFDDIKPSIVGITNASGARIDMFSDFAYDRNDNDETDEEGNYLHPYFFAKLRRFDGVYGFNLFEHTIEEDEMVISMTSGNCGACNFVIGVDSETQKNTVQVDANGNLLRDDDGNILFGSPQDRQNDTQNYEVWIALRKDIETFGVIMPNATNNYKPNAGDTFVILHIDLPQSYIEAAENRLKEEIIKYMAMNNSEKFTFSITFSRIFFAENLDILAQLNENARLQIEYNSKTYELYVSSYSYNMTSDKALPEIRVELSDTLTITQNALQTAISEVKTDIMNSVGSIDWLRLGLKYFLRKDTNDRSRGKVASDVGFEVGKYVSGTSGAIVYVDKTTGQTVAELDKLYVRMKAYFESLEIVNVNSVGGKQIISPAGSIKCVDVKDREVDVSGNEVIWDYYRCYFLSEQDGEKIENRYAIGDQAYCQLFNARSGVNNNITNKYYWRLVVGVGENYIDLSKSDCDSGSDIPDVGDVICHRGNRNDVDRQNVIEFSSVDSFSPSITLYQGINSYSLSGKDIVSFGVDKTTNKAFMNVYGDMYVGDRNNTSYMRYTQENGLELKGRLAIGTTLSDGRELEQAIKDATPEGYKEFVEKVLGDLGSLQQQVDGAIDSYFYEYAPTLDNYPANEWDTDAEKEAHLNDTFTNLLDGRSWRWAIAGWVEITDTATTKALAIAGQAKDTADGKRRVFISTPYPPYDEGDLWAGGSNMPLMRCVVAKGENGVFEESDWDYADNTTKQLAGYEYLKRALGESTTVEGGLIQTSLLMLGYTSNGTFHVMSGTNGLYDSTKLGGGIAAWYGGPMADKEADSSLVSYAQSLFRFDGSGYLAGGNITWDKYGAGSVAGGDISWDKDGVITLGQNIKISGDTNETLSSILSFINEYRSLWTLDADNNAVRTKLNVIIEQAISFGGVGDSGTSGGVTTLGALSDVQLGTLKIGDSLVWNGTIWTNQSGGTGFSESAMWTALGGSAENKVIASEHIPDLSGKYLPITGGTINAASWKALVLDNSVRPTDGIALHLSISNTTKGGIVYNGEEIMLQNATSLQYLSIKDDGTPTYNGSNILIHSGNIGIYALKNIGSASVDSARGAFGYDNTSQGSVDIPNAGGFISVDIAKYGFQLLGEPRNQGLYYRGLYNNELNAWRTIAFTDSDITGNAASATKLQDNTVFTAWGQTFFKDGKPKNIDTTTYGMMRWLYFSNSSGVEQGYVGRGSDTNDIFLVTYGENSLRFSTNNSIRATITPNGNILVGATKDNGSILMIHSSVSSSARPTLGNLKGDIVTIGSSGYYGLHLWNEGSGDGLIQVGRSDGKEIAYNLALQPLGGNVLIGTTSDTNGYKLQVHTTTGAWASLFTTSNASVTISHIDGYGLSINSKSNNSGRYLFSVSYNHTTLGTGGTNAFQVKDNGHVLIGTTTDSGRAKVLIDHDGTYPLMLNGSANYSVISYYSRGAAVADIGWLNDNRGNLAYVANVSTNNQGVVSVNNSGVYYTDNASTFTKYPILHSGNIESYGGVFGGNLNINLNDIRTGFRAGKLDGASNAASYISSFRGFLEYGAYGYTAQYNSDNSNNLYYRWCENSTWLPWRTFAFLDSNVASAQNLMHSNGSVGATVLSDGTLSAEATTVASLNGGTPITSLNIGSQSVAYATNAGNADYADEAEYAYNVGVSTSSSNSNYNLVFHSGSSLYSNSKIKINPYYGNLVLDGSVTFGTASDRRLKSDIRQMTDAQALRVLQALNPVTFVWNSTAYELGRLSGASDGFIADEYESLIPNSGRDIWGNYRAIDYERVVSYLTKGWQINHNTSVAHSRKINTCELKIARLEKKVVELETKLKQYEYGNNN